MTLAGNVNDDFTMSGRRNSKRNSMSAESELASKRHKPDDSSIITHTNGDNNDKQAGPRVPSFDEDAIAKLPGKERSCLVDLPYPDQVQKHVRWRGERTAFSILPSLYLPDGTEAD
jgi:hypothetical protein